MKKKKPFDKYEFYAKSVQYPPEALRFLDRVYRAANNRSPAILGEDFSGTFAMCAEWIQWGDANRAVAVDLDPEPIAWGMEHYLQKLSPAQRRHLQVIRADVRRPRLPKVDVLAALNFSYFIFLEREALLSYFKAAVKRLRPGGVFVIDCFGGSENGEPNEDKVEHDDFCYYWEQFAYDPLSNRSRFSIHYKRRGEKKRKHVFRYDWRLWSLPELREILTEAGFGEIDIYLEGTDREGDGNGVFSKRTRAQNEATWLAYLVAHPRRR